MARKSLETMLVEAVGAGDLEKAKELALKIKTKTEKRPTTPKNKKTVKLPAKKIKHEPPEEVIDEEVGDGYIDKPKRKPGKNKENASSGIACRTEPFRVMKRKNTFVDDKQECKEDANIALTRPIKTKKKKFKNQQIECKICGKVYTVAPIFYRRDEEGESLYRCNACCGGK